MWSECWVGVTATSPNLCLYSPGYHWPPLLPGLALGPCATCCVPGPPGSFPHSCFSGSWPQAVPIPRKFLPRDRTLHMSLLNFNLFILPVHVPQDGSPALEKSDWAPQFGINCRLMTVQTMVLSGKEAQPLSEKSNIFT